jgi:hypothetical protein
VLRRSVEYQYIFDRDGITLVEGPNKILPANVCSPTDHLTSGLLKFYSSKWLHSAAIELKTC